MTTFAMSTLGCKVNTYESQAYVQGLLELGYTEVDFKEKADIYEQLAQLNKQIRAERKKIKLCREIADSAAKMQQDIAVQEKSQQEKEASQTRDYK